MENKTINLLVVEDNPKFLSDITQLMDDRKANGVNIKVDYARTFNEAFTYLLKNQYDGVMTDLFFPIRDGDDEEAAGVAIAREATDKKIPTVVVTSTYHHGAKTEIVRGSIPSKVPLIDRYISDGREEDTEKEFAGAYLTLMYMIENPDQGTQYVVHHLINNLAYYRRENEKEKIKKGIKEFRLKKIVEKYCRGMSDFE